MAAVQNASLPLALSVHSASPHEVTLVHQLLAERTTTKLPERMIGDKAFDSGGLDARLAEQGTRTHLKIARMRIKAQASWPRAR